MKRLGLLTMVLAVVFCGTSAWADFYVVGGGGPRVGTRITGVPYTISSPGFYYLGSNLSISISSGSAISVNADNVTLDLMGFELINTAAGVGSSNGILMSGRSNVEIRNGTVRGFLVGIYEDASQTGAKHRISNIRAVANWYGIWLEGQDHQVNACTGANGQIGIFIGSGMITGSVATNNAVHGIEMLGTGSLINNIANNNVNTGFLFGTGNVMVDRNSASGNGTNYSAGGASTAWGVNAGR